MAEHKQEKIIASYFWLNPSVKEDGIYKIHVNYQLESGKWMYNKIPPQSLPLDEKMVFAPELITDDEKRGLVPEYPLTNPQKTEQLSKGQTNRSFALKANIKAAQKQTRNILRIHGDWERRKNEADSIIRKAELIKKRKIEYCYIGNSEPIASGITAFFIIRYADGYQDEYSLRDIMRMDRDYDIHEWYEMYYQEQLNRWEKNTNKKLIIAQGRLSPEAFIDKFNRTHLVSEQKYYEESQGFFSKNNGTNEPNLTTLQEYVKGYLDWVADKLSSEQLNHNAKKSQQGYNTEYDREQLFMIHKQIIDKGFLTESFMSAQDFIDAFSGKIIESPMPYIGSKKKLGSIIFLITGKRPIPSEVNKIFLFYEKGAFDSDDFQKKIHAGLQGIIDLVK